MARLTSSVLSRATFAALVLSSFFLISQAWCETSTPYTNGTAPASPANQPTSSAPTHAVVASGINSDQIDNLYLGDLNRFVQATEEFEAQFLLQHAFLRECLSQLQKATITIIGLTFDGNTFSFSLLKLGAFLQLVIIQPYLLGVPRRKQLRWGEVYDSTTKSPLDFTTVRLLNKTGKTVIQSKVTDSLGRYAFMVGPGKYIIEVVNRSYVFPSVLLRNNINDGRFSELYHGESIAVSAEDGVVAVTIPVDPADQRLRPAKLLHEQWFSRLKASVAWLGLFISLLAFAVTPGLYMGLFLLVQVAVFTGERVKAVPQKTKSWGVVRDSKTKKPLLRAVVRLYSLHFNKLIASQVTDNRGRYYFLVGDNEYYTTFEHPDYFPEKSAAIDLKGRPAETITLDVGLKKRDTPQTTAPTAAPESAEVR